MNILSRFVSKAALLALATRKDIPCQSLSTVEIADGSSLRACHWLRAI
jgi:hypothetical protein